VKKIIGMQSPSYNYLRSHIVRWIPSAKKMRQRIISKVESDHHESPRGVASRAETAKSPLPVLTNERANSRIPNHYALKITRIPKSKESGSKVALCSTGQKISFVILSRTNIRRHKKKSKFILQKKTSGVRSALTWVLIE